MKDDKIVALRPDLAYGAGIAQRGTSGSDGGDGMEARIAKLEATVEHIQSDISEIKTDFREHRTTAQTDFRLLFGALIAVALGLATIMAHGFHWI